MDKVHRTIVYVEQMSYAVIVLLLVEWLSNLYLLVLRVLCMTIDRYLCQLQLYAV